MSRPEEAPAGICCGWPRRIVAVALTDNALAIATCDLCGRRQWFRDGEPISSREAIGRDSKADLTREGLQAARQTQH
jgi:hypothetical protein